jgi:hypothetical protein
MSTIDATEAKLSAHELVCAERYAGINARLKRIEKIMIGCAGAIILFLVGIAFKVH